MANGYDVWLDRVRAALRSINMSIDDWQPVWPFDFSGEHEKGTDPDGAAMKANRYWWYQQNRSIGRECDTVPGCWLPRGHQGECQPQYEAGRPCQSRVRGQGWNARRVDVGNCTGTRPDKACCLWDSR